MSYLLHILILVAFYAVLASSLNLLAGYTGLLSLCTAAFFGLGAYTAALLTLRLGWPWPLALIAAMALSSTAAAVIGSAALRFRDDYFAIATFAFQLILNSVMVNWVEATQGPLGLPGIPQLSLFGWTLVSRADYLILALLYAALAILVLRRLVRAPYGRILQAIREDEVFVASHGKNVAAYKISAFVAGTVLTALAGALWAPYVSYIDPSSFSVEESIFILSIVIIGGAGNLWGSVLGAAFLVALPEALRFLGVPSSVAANLRQILYGLLLAACMIWRPQGLAGRYGFEEGRKA